MHGRWLARAATGDGQLVATEQHCNRGRAGALVPCVHELAMLVSELMLFMANGFRAEPDRVSRKTKWCSRGGPVVMLRKPPSPATMSAGDVFLTTS